MKKGYDLWVGALVAILISVPILGAIIQLTHIAAMIAYINGHAVVAAVILIAGYAMLWGIWHQLDNVAGRIGNVASSATGKMRKGLADYRANTRKRRTQEAVEGKRDIAGARMATGLLRRAHMADKGGFSLSRRGQARYRAAETAMLQKTAAQMVKEDEGRAGGDDDLMELAMTRGMTEERAEREYAARLQARGVGAAEAQRRATQAVAKASVGLGAKWGTDAMRVSAYKALLDSKTSYTDPTGANAQDTWERMIGDGTSLMEDGLMDATDVTMAIKQRGDRADRAGVGFGTLLGQVERSYTRRQQGAARGRMIDNAQTRAARATMAAAGMDVDTGTAQQRAQAERQIAAVARTATEARAQNPAAVLTTEQQAAMTIMDAQLVNANEATGMRKEALFGTQAGAVVAGRHEAVSALAGTMRDNVQESVANLQVASAAATAAGVNAGNFQAHLDAARVARAANPTAVLSAQQQGALQQAQAQEQHDRELAAVAGRYDAMGQISPQNATIMANNVMSQMITDPVSGQQITIQAAIEAARGRAGFQEMRREYMTGAMAQAQNMGGINPPPLVPPPPSDRRLKRNIEPVGTFNGIQLYRFQYLWSDQFYVGVMAQDLLGTKHADALGNSFMGYYTVDYAKLGTRMYTLEEWEANNRRAQLTR